MSYNLLKGKKGIIFGALDEKSIAWKTAIRCHEEGAQIVLSNAPVALRMGEINKLAAQIEAPIIGADVVNMDDLKKLFEETTKHFNGGIDFILHSIGMSLNMRKGKNYTEIDYGFNQKNTRHFCHKPSPHIAHRVGDGCPQRMGQRSGAYLHCRTARIPRLQRNGRCKIPARKRKQKLWLPLCTTQKSARKHRLSIAHQNHCRQRR